MIWLWGPDLYFLIDECVTSRAARLLDQFGQAWCRVTATPALGAGSSDAAIFRFAAAHGAIILTCNRVDFERLYARHARRPCILAIPSLPADRTARCLRTFLEGERRRQQPEPAPWFRQIIDHGVAFEVINCGARLMPSPPDAAL